MYEKRNASGQLVNVLIELGDRDRGIGSASVMFRRYNRPETPSGTGADATMDR
jgi:hypothetical protein